MSGAGETLQAAALTALRAVPELGVYDALPVQSVAPNAIVEAGPERDWSHKSGTGRELRLAVTLQDMGERPLRLRRLIGEVEAAVAGLPPQLAGWQLVTLQLLRSGIVGGGRKSGDPWIAALEYRARMLAV